VKPIDPALGKSYLSVNVTALAALAIKETKAAPVTTILIVIFPPLYRCRSFEVSTYFQDKQAKSFASPVTRVKALFQNEIQDQASDH